MKNRVLFIVYLQLMNANEFHIMMKRVKNMNLGPEKTAECQCGREVK